MNIQRDGGINKTLAIKKPINFSVAAIKAAELGVGRPGAVRPKRHGIGAALQNTEASSRNMQPNLAHLVVPAATFPRVGAQFSQQQAFTLGDTRLGAFEVVAQLV